MMWGYPGYWNWGGMLIMMLSSVIWVALITAVVVLVVRRLGSHSTSLMGPSHAPSAMEILEQRYARGEIDEGTFQHMRDELHAEQLHVTPT
ncbi:MAG TPA: SHOCT domain-containing protein [Ktedonobacterales bacterium]